MLHLKQLSPAQALQKARHFCAYQERCHNEVKEKLYSLGLRKAQVDDALGQLIEENYLNEERFARHFAGGKFRMKHWGRIKIRYALKQKQISEYCIKKALQEIDEMEYRKILETLAMEKWESLKSSPNRFIRIQKLKNWLIQKGYESSLIDEVLHFVTPVNKQLT